MANPIPPPSKPVQIRCPLTLKRLDEIPNLSDEHIIHEAIGGPRWYSVKADAAENSRFGKGPDSRFLNSDIVKLWRIRNGILGKSEKELSLRLNGKVKGKDQNVIVTFKQASTEVDYVPRLIRNKDGRTGRIVVSAGHAEQELVRITNDFAEKRIRLTVTDKTSLEPPELDIPFEIDLAPLWAGALKVAYLTAFHFLGDHFLDDPLNSAWRRAIEAETMDKLKESPIRFQLRISGPIPCPLTPTQHFVYITNAGPRGRSVIVHLFGGQIGVGAVLSEYEKLGVPDCPARAIYCDAKNSTVHGFDGPGIEIPQLPTM